MRNLRRISQTLFLLLFLFLAFATRYGGTDQIQYPVKVFLDFDPLIFLSTLLTAHTIPLTLLGSLLLIFITVLLGRVFCGWICPLGTLNHLMSALRKRGLRGKEAERLFRWQPVKYYLLVFLLVSSLFTLQWVGFFDPISLLIRSFALFIDPALNLVVQPCIVFLSGSKVPVLNWLSEHFRNWGQEAFLSFEPPHFHQAAVVGFLFLGILALNLLGGRFFCVGICPLGGLLGLLSRYSLPRLRIAEHCNSCETCNLHCQTAATPHPASSWKGSECTYCWNCEDLCPVRAVKFQVPKMGAVQPGLNLERRILLGSAIAGLLSVPLFRIGPAIGSPSPRLIRPPGARPEADFLRRCIRCGECMKVCPTHGLQPALFQAGGEGLWSPVLTPRIGYCEYSCTLCGQVCPTGAIERLLLERKQKVRIGLAFVDQNRCLPLSQGIPCIVCEEHCPTPKKAIWLEQGWLKDREGKRRPVQIPRVDLDLCIGCGICEKRCPVLDLPAIRVSSIGESRNPNHQLILPSKSAI